jgi:pyruvate formate lyase activating enzyme
VKEVMFYKKLPNNKVHCYLCPHNCCIASRGKGICNVRENIDGTLYTANYNKISSISMDAIEKKPLYHFYPGSQILSVGSFGCNFKCSFCQNWQIAHGNPDTRDITSEELISIAMSQNNNIGLAYTYNEPSIWYEFIYETAKEAKEKGLKNVMVTNGYISEEPLNMLMPYIDAMNIDVKGFKDAYYKEICKGQIEPVIRTVEAAFKKCHVEVTTLMVTGLNDDIEEIIGIAKWLNGISKDIPLHISRYFPNYKLCNEPTSVDTLIKAVKEASRYLNYVYVGNLWGYDNTTYCPKCKEPIIIRKESVSLCIGENSNCLNCGEKIQVIY